MEHLTGELGCKYSKDTLPSTALGLDYPRAIDSPPTKLQDDQTDEIALIWVQLGYEVVVYEVAL